MSSFSFEGNFKRRPAQNLGGRSRHPDNRDDTLLRAQLEREKRENERSRASAILVLQAGIRGMRERRNLNLLVRQDFQRDVTPKYSIDILELQMMRLNYFFRPTRDVQVLCDLGKSMLLLKDQLVTRILENERSVLRLRLILEKSLTGLSDPTPTHRNTMLRLLETFTDWNQIEATRVALSNDLDSSRTEKVMAVIWSNLVLQKNFFSRYQSFLEDKLDVRSADAAKKALLHYDYTVFYHRFLEVMRILSLSSSNFTIAKTTYTAKELVQALLLKLAESLCGILRLKGQRVTNGTLEFIICPRVAEGLTLEQDGKSLWCVEWLDVMSNLAENNFCPNDDIQSSIKLRPVMYSFLIMIRLSRQWTTRQNDMLKIINSMMMSIDNRKNLFVKPRRDENAVDDDDDDELMEDLDETAAKEAEMAFDFFADRDKIYQELENVLNNMHLDQWMGEFSVVRWRLLYHILSCIIEKQPLFATMHFRFLATLYNKSSFMRSLCLHVMSEKSSKEELVVFCWLLNQLMRILHDGEFSTGIPLSKDELLYFIRLLKDSYTDIVLGDKDVSDHLEDYFKKEIAHTLMAIHDRNTRINLYSEDIFLSSKFTVVFPMETHNIRFRDFSKESGSPDSLSMLDHRLLRVLIDFPFALSFHDRVSIWHQMLNMDHMERQISDNPLGRQHIQIRRNYIYEDAFEKLSYENVPDLRSDVRISLVNVVGVQEAGVDGGGLLREFLTEATKAGVNPNRGLFRVDSENRIYPNPIAKKIFFDYLKHFFLMGRLVGKALYRQILLELPLAAFFMQYCAFGSVSSAVDYLATLDPDLHKNLLKLRSFVGDWSELGLDFTMASEELGEARVVELKPNGRNISVDHSNVIEYIHLVADYKINREILEECRCFRAGLHDVVPILRIFSWKEMQTLISGSDKPINVEDWKANTNYGGGYSATHKTIVMFWEVVEQFDEEYLRKLLKFVTSCSRPPLLGFKDLLPKFGISSAGVTDRLPTAATCMNLLKLPEFGDIETLRERLVYAINAQAGFELS